MNNNICYGCMTQKGADKECPRCGYIEGTPAVAPALEPGTMLADRYLVGRRLMMNGEGITYIGLDTVKNKRVTIREFMPFSLCSRRKDGHALVVANGLEAVYDDYLEDFLECARALSRLSEVPAIVPVIDMFECNNTAYYVSAYVVGKNLTEIVRRAGSLTWDEAYSIFLPLINSVMSVHSVGLMHFGIAPDNIIMTREGSLRLIGFGSPDVHLAETDLKPELYDGFSALEQYAIEGRKGKWTDVYGLCAVMLFALTGKRPPSAVERSYESSLELLRTLEGEVPDHVIAAIAAGLQVKPESRTHTADELRNALCPRVDSAAASAAVTTSEKPDYSGLTFVQKVTKWLENRTQLQYALLAALVTLLLGGIIVLIAGPSIRTAIAGGDTGNQIVGEVGTPVPEDEEAEVPTYEVPNLLGTSWEASAAEYYSAELQLILIEEDFSDVYAEGYIMEQNIQPGTSVTEGTLIGVKVSRGPKMREVPAIIGMTVAKASDALEAQGLRLGEQTEEYNASVGIGCIIRTNGCEVGSKLEYDSAVAVVISKGPDPLA